MRRSALTLALCVSLSCFAQQKPQNVSVKDCLNIANTASGMAAEYSDLPFSTKRLEAISRMEDKLVGCANLPTADVTLLYSLFDAEIRLAAAKQVWLEQIH
jgi:hypothetical protein